MKSVLDSMNFKGIFVVGVVIAIIGVVVVSPMNLKNTPPSLKDDLNMTDSVLINSNLPNNDKVKLEDNSSVEKSSDLKYYLDVNGSKHFILDVKDDVNLSE
ncbi:MAG TPA: hypothetical protein HA319_04490 [Nitrosopumilaceae archaeon]|nr:hypothetical protein [Nitrosopumilaceae archaeon]